MNLLEEPTYKGKLVIVNIHQPGSDVFQMFDKILIIDRGGYQIFYGNPSEAIVYFKTKASFATPGEDQCISCGNLNANELLQIIEAKVVNEQGKPTPIRKVPPENEQKVKEVFKPDPGSYREKQKLPENNFCIPGLFKQTKIFFIRDILSKIADKQYVLISVLGAPLLALLLAYFTRSGKGGDYLFSDNQNIPAYLFMCVITSLFLGLIMSAEEDCKGPQNT